ncbi:MAG: hypothetical protein K2K02_04820, partial [Ruminococcus sp.]|nr:hypothetical protein [Ruminococcus sp.]
WNFHCLRPRNRFAGKCHQCGNVHKSGRFCTVFLFLKKTKNISTSFQKNLKKYLTNNYFLIII